MRLRLLIPAAMAAAATYAALVREDQTRAAVALGEVPHSPGEARREAPAVLRPVPALLDEAPPAPRPSAGASIFDDLTPAPAPPGASILDLLAGSPSAPEPPREPAPDPAPPSPARVIEAGRFALGGWAAAGGHSVVSGVTFRRRLPEQVGAERIELEIDAADNVPEGGLVVLSDPGFAPDRDGFTLLLAAADPGPFSAAGSYRVVTAGER